MTTSCYKRASDVVVNGFVLKRPTASVLPPGAAKRVRRQQRGVVESSVHSLCDEVWEALRSDPSIPHALAAEPPQMQ